MHRRSLRLIAVGAATAVGAAFVYFLDPVHGPERRRAALAWMTTTVRGLLGEPARTERPEAFEAAPRPESEPVGREPARLGDVVGTGTGRAGGTRIAAEPAPERPPAPERESSAPERESAVLFLEGDAAPPTRIVAYDEQETPVEGARAGEPVPPLWPRPRRRVLSFRVLAGLSAVAAVSAIGLAGWAVLLEREEETSAATAPTRADEDQAKAIALLAEPDSSRIPVTGSRGTLVLVVGSGGDAVLILRNVRRAPQGKTYEAWVIDGDQPTPAGLFSGSETVVPLTTDVPKGAVVAVTLEPAGGVDAPTTKPIFATTAN